MTKVKLTGFGEFVYLHGVQTPPKFWQDLSKEVERIADQDGDWEQLIQERMVGLSDFMQRRRRYGESKNWPTDKHSDQQREGV